MPRNGSGSFSLPQPPFVPNTTISSTAVNQDLSDIAAALSGSIASDGQTPITASLLGFSSGTAATPSWAFEGAENSGFYPAGSGNIGVSVAGNNVATFTPTGLISNSTPIGAIMDFAGSAAPAAWLLCFGQPISRTTYAVLFGIIGTTYGVGDGSTTFNLPDCRGRATYGQDNMGGTAANRITVAGGNFDGTVLGGTGGGQNHTLTTPEIPSHTHTHTDPGHTHTYNSPTAGTSVQTGGTSVSDAITFTSTGSATTGITIQNTGGGTAHTVLDPAIIFNKIIFAGA